MKNLFKILILSLLVYSCDVSVNSVSGSNEVDVDWVLIKNPNMDYNTWNCDGDYEDVEGIGYYFYYTNSSGITDLSIEENEDYQIIFNNNEGILSFSYNGENFSFNLSDSNIGEDEPCYFIYVSSDYIDRIIYNPNMNYFTLFGDTGSLDLNSSTPNELIDYR